MPAPIALSRQEAPVGTAAAVGTAPTRPYRNVIVQAEESNTSPIYIGPAGITTDNGLALASGREKAYAASPAEIYVVATETGQFYRVQVE